MEITQVWGAAWEAEETGGWETGKAAVKFKRTENPRIKNKLEVSHLEWATLIEGAGKWNELMAMWNQKVNHRE